MIHREGDLPAREYTNGFKQWYTNGEFHRNGGPAIVHPDGRGEWYQHGKLHSQYGNPAKIIETDNGGECCGWCWDGELHRDNDLPAVIEYYGKAAALSVKKQIWTQAGNRHRQGDRPAVIEYYKDGKEKERGYWKDGKLHRDPGKGPAIENDKNLGQIWINGKFTGLEESS